MRYVCLLVIICISCGPDLPPRAELVDSFYQLRVKELFLQQRADCIEQIQIDAKLELDSIVHELLNADLMDTINFPTRPTRPVSPDHIIGTVKKFDVDN